MTTETGTRTELGGTGDRALGQGLDATLKAALAAVAMTGALFAVAGCAAYDARVGGSVAIGGAVAVANLYALARLLNGVLAGRGPLWGVLAAGKVAALLGG